MSKPFANLFANIEEEFDSVKSSLNDLNESIKRVTGRDPSRSFRDDASRTRLRNINGESLRGGRIGGLKRKLNLENENDSFAKRSLQSQVVSTSWEVEQRNQVLERQKNDKKSLSRNKRMFGMILGTLEKFKNEESQRKDVQKRVEIEQKLDQAAEEEREALKKERKDLFQKRKEKQSQMRCLALKMQRAEIHKEWEQSQQFIGHFIETKAKPHIFYMPVKHNTETTRRLEETKDKYRIILAEKRAKVQKELDEIDELFKKEPKENAEKEEKALDESHIDEMSMEEDVKPSIDGSKSNGKNGRSSMEEMETDLPDKVTAKSPATLESLDSNSQNDAKVGELVKEELLDEEMDKSTVVKEEVLDEEMDKSIDREFEPIYD